MPPRLDAFAAGPVHAGGGAGKSSLDWFPAALQVKQVEEQVAALRSSLICAFNQLLDLKDLNTGVHSTRLAEWALHVAGELGLDESCLGDIEVAALLHDIGKIGISDAHPEQARQADRRRIRPDEKASGVWVGGAAPECREWSAPA